MKLLDLFSGIGGFHLGLEQAGFEFDWVGFSDIDKYANKLYKDRFPEAEELGDVTTIRPERLPTDITILCGGFPCQAFSVAGKRKGFDDRRGTLFFEIERILRYFKEIGKPIPYFILENVKGLLNHDNGRTFATIYGVLTDLDYTIECQLLNTRWFLPQNRERIYIVGYVGGRGRSKIFPIREDASRVTKGTIKATNVRCLQGGGHSGGHHSGMTLLKQIGTIGKDSEATRVYDPSGISRTIKNGGGMGAKIGLYQVGDLKIIAKKRTYDTPPEINEYLKRYKKHTIQQISQQLELPKTQVEHYFRADRYRAIPSPKIWLQLKELLGFDDTYDKQVTEIYEKEYEFESATRVYSDKGISKTINTNETGLYKISEATKKGYAIAKEGDSINLSVPNSKTRRGRVGKGVAQTLDTGMQQYTINPKSNIRRLTPMECERLQGFPDNWTENGQSDTQRYKQLGNAVSVPVVKAVGGLIATSK